MGVSNVAMDKETVSNYFPTKTIFKKHQNTIDFLVLFKIDEINGILIVIHRNSSHFVRA